MKSAQESSWFFYREMHLRLRGLIVLFSYVLINIIGSAVGAFLGFVGALYLQNRADKRAKKNRNDLVLRNIRDEISDISLTLSKYLEKNTPLNFSIQTPNWDAALYSGDILEFIENPIYPQTINAYSSIKRFNDLRSHLNKSDNLSYIKAIVDTSNCITRLE